MWTYAKLPSTQKYNMSGFHSYQRSYGVSFSAVDTWEQLQICAAVTTASLPQWIEQIGTFKHAMGIFTKCAIQPSCNVILLWCPRNWTLNVDTAWFSKNYELLLCCPIAESQHIFHLNFHQIYIFNKFIKCFTFMFRKHCLHKSRFFIGKCDK